MRSVLTLRRFPQCSFKIVRVLSTNSDQSGWLFTSYLTLSVPRLAGEEEELAKLVQRLDKTSTAYGMGIRAEKTKAMTINTSGINTEIEINGQKLETVTSFKYLGSRITDEGSKPEILSRKAQTAAALDRLRPV